MDLNPTAVRNILIIGAVAVLAVVWSTGFATITNGLSNIILVVFVFAMIGFGYQYFRQNELAWSVISETRRKIMIGCAAGVILLLVFGFSFLAPTIGLLSVILLIAALVAVIAWIVWDSRRFHA